MDIIRNMKAFVAVADTGSFTKAAYQLSVAPSAISRSITEFEVHLRTRLRNQITSRGELFGNGLGKTRWVFERLAFIHEVFIKIGRGIVCCRQLKPSLSQRFRFKRAVPFYLRAPMMHASSFPSVRT